VLLHKVEGSGIAARLVGLSERIESVAFSPDGKRLPRWVFTEILDLLSILPRLVGS
jgi:hypothetical protein